MKAIKFEWWVLWLAGFFAIAFGGAGFFGGNQVEVAIGLMFLVILLLGVASIRKLINEKKI